jgi:NAD(P)H-hydrate epimerase
MRLIETILKLKPRAADAHKGDFGKICIIAGSVGFSGAAALAGKAALRSGAGLVRIACPKSILPIIAAIEPSYTTIPLPEDSEGKISKKAINQILTAVEENDCVAFGPGVGVSSDLQQILYCLLEQQKPIIIDADGLNNLAKMNNWPEKRKANLIITPHPGEMKRLWLGILRESMPEDRVKQAVQLAKQTKTIVVLKGAGTVVTDGQKVYVNKTGNPGMATAGSGDVLTGCITALIGQGLSLLEAAILGVYVHGLAGDIAAENKGQISMIATDIIDALPEAFKKNK